MKTTLIILASVVVTSLIWVVGIAGAYLYFFSTPPPFQVEVRAPMRVVPGQEFDMVVSATNPSESELTLDSVDVYDTLLAGFELVRVSPTPVSDEKILNFRSFGFSHPIASGDHTKVIFTLKAGPSGYFAGDIDVCRPDQRFTTVATGIVIESPNADP